MNRDSLSDESTRKRVITRFRDFSPKVIFSLEDDAAERAVLLEAARLFMLRLRYDMKAIKLGKASGAAKRRFEEAFK